MIEAIAKRGAGDACLPSAAAHCSTEVGIREKSHELGE
jgi:hypothetical protein